MTTLEKLRIQWAYISGPHGVTGDAERRVVAVPELRGGLLQHALKKITEVTGLLLTLCLLPDAVRSQRLDKQHLEDGAQVVIRGPHGQLSHCAKLVLRAAAGDFHALSTAELFQQVSAPKKLTDSKDASGQTPLQVIGISTGCDLTLHGSKLQIQGPSAAIAKGAMKKVERFLASDTTDVNEVLQAAKAGPRNRYLAGWRLEDIQTRAAALRRPQSRRPSKKDAEEREERAAYEGLQCDGRVTFSPVHEKGVCSGWPAQSGGTPDRVKYSIVRGQGGQIRSYFNTNCSGDGDDKISYFVFDQCTRDLGEGFVEIPNLSRNRLLNCQGAMIRKLQELYGVQLGSAWFPERFTQWMNHVETHHG
eukprot:s3747_g3.t2